NELRKWNDFGFQGTPGPLALTNTAPNAAVVGEGVARVLQLCAKLGLRRCAAPEGSHKADRTGGPLPPDLIQLAAEAAAGSPQRKDTRIELLAATANGAPNVASLSVI